MDENVELTSRDREYLRGLFLLGGGDEPVGPSELGELIEVSKVAALEKMRRLEAMGLGEYIHRQGLLLNKVAVTVVQRDIRRHHVVEKFLEDNLGMDSTEACRESSAMDPYVSDNFLNIAAMALGDGLSCDCGCCIEEYYDPKVLYECHWFKKQFHV